MNQSMAPELSKESLKIKIRPLPSFSFPSPVYIVFVLLFYYLLWAGFSHAAEIVFAWDPNPEPDVAGYKICYGFSAGSYSNCIDVGNVTRFTLSDPTLIAGQTCYFSLKAYNTNARESAFCNEISYTIPASTTTTVSVITTSQTTTTITAHEIIIDNGKP